MIVCIYVRNINEYISCVHEIDAGIRIFSINQYLGIIKMTWNVCIMFVRKEESSISLTNRFCVIVVLI